VAPGVGESRKRVGEDKDLLPLPGMLIMLVVRACLSKGRWFWKDL